VGVQFFEHDGESRPHAGACSPVDEEGDEQQERHASAQVVAPLGSRLGREERVERRVHGEHQHADAEHDLLSPRHVLPPFDR
jgi:hypothetical protein